MNAIILKGVALGQPPLPQSGPPSQNNCPPLHYGIASLFKYTNRIKLPGKCRVNIGVALWALCSIVTTQWVKGLSSTEILKQSISADTSMPYCTCDVIKLQSEYSM
jgi:hypothetical protein